MNDNTSSGSTAKKRGRPAKVKEQEDTVVGAITEEDLALDRELERLAQEQPPDFGDDKNENVLRHEKDERDLLSEYVDNYNPAKTLIDLDGQVFQAKSLGADSIEVTKDVFRHFCGPDNGKNANYTSGYFMYKDIKAYLTGKAEESKARDALTMEDKLFGKKK